jgi:nucleoside-diphosphate-sugar epimerase
MKKKLFITGAAGFVGTMLVDSLLEEGHFVVAFDNFWFGNHLASHSNLRVISGDLRTFDFTPILDGVEIAIHLACISNDPSYELDEKISYDVNFIGSRRFIDACQRGKVKKIIYASSSSVYGIKNEYSVHEELALDPLTLYSKYKMEIESYLKENYEYDFVILRPATVCGYSRRLRLDVVGNIFTSQAFFNKKITVHGGSQERPQLSMSDMVGCYKYFANLDEKFNREIYNVGDQNIKLLDLANLVASKMDFGVELEVLSIVDQRSYRIDSTKIFTKTEFKLQSSIDQAILNLIGNLKLLPKGTWLSSSFYNVKKMKEILR